jgi:hypothetical protein
MKAKGSITPIDALNDLGCMRLATRIFELKKEGNMIKTLTEFRTNMSGETKHYARYVLIKDESGVNKKVIHATNMNDQSETSSDM